MTQEDTIAAALIGYNIFITGAAGTGKSHTLNKCIKALKNREKTVAVTASTGIAATHINGRTIHSWSGINIYNKEELEIELGSIISKRTVKEKVAKADVLVIDEISMLHAYQLDAIDKICRAIRALDEPFGGLQIIFCGDFFQLPPVTRGSEKATYVFDSRIWNSMDLKICYLEEQFRCIDSNYMNILTEIRSGNVSIESKKLLATRINKPINNVKDPLQLFTINKKVDEINNQKLARIDQPPEEFYMRKYFSDAQSIEEERENSNLLTALVNGCMAPETLILKKTAQVMFIKNNFIKGYVNGSLGEVIDFDEETGYPIVKLASNGSEILATPEDWKSEKVKLVRKTDEEIAFEMHMKADVGDDPNGVEKFTEITNGARIEQVPLKLAWAITIHKCISGNTLLSTEVGLEYIKDIAKDVPEGTVEEAAFNVHSHKSIQKADQIFHGKIEQCKHIVTESGFSITSSYRHPLFVRNNDGNHIWKKTLELKKDDILILKKGVGAATQSNNIPKKYLKIFTNKHTKEFTLPEYLTPDLSWVLGIIIGNGCVTDVTDGRVGIIHLSIELITRYNKIIKSIFNRNSTVGRHGICFTSYFHSKPVRDFLYNIGLEYNKARKKHIPEIIRLTTIENQRAFIQGMFDTDGGVNKYCIHYTSTSELLINEAQVLLLNLGIVGSKRLLTHGLRIQITGQNAIKFMHTIGFSEESRIKKGKERYGGYRYTIPKMQRGGFPDSTNFTIKLKDDLCTVYGISYGNIKRLHIANKKITKFLSRVIRGTALMYPESLEYIIKELPEFFNKKEFEHYKELTNLIFERIVSLTPVKEKVYDIHVPEDHSYIGNGFINHNSQGMSLDYAKMELGNVFVEGQGYVALSRVRSLNGVSLVSISDAAFRINPRIFTIDKYLKDASAEFLKELNYINELENKEVVNFG